mgnify:FL=1
MQIIILQNGLFERFFQNTKQLCGLLYQSVRSGFTHFKTIFSKEPDNPFYRHGINVAQLQDAGNERGVITGV